MALCSVTCIVSQWQLCLWESEGWTAGSVEGEPVTPPALASSCVKFKTVTDRALALRHVFSCRKRWEDWACFPQWPAWSGCLLKHQIDQIFVVKWPETFSSWPSVADWCLGGGWITVPQSRMKIHLLRRLLQNNCPRTNGPVGKRFRPTRKHSQQLS